VPRDPISSLVKEAKRALENPKMKPGTESYEHFKETFRYRLNDVGNYIFDNEVEILWHMGAPFEKVMDDVVDAYRHVVERLIREIPELELISNPTRAEAIRTLLNSPEFIYSSDEKFKANMALPGADPRYWHVTEAK